MWCVNYEYGKYSMYRNYVFVKVPTTTLVYTLLEYRTVELWHFALGESSEGGMRAWAERSAGKDCVNSCAWWGNPLFCLFIVPCLQFLFFFSHFFSTLFSSVVFSFRLLPILKFPSVSEFAQHTLCESDRTLMVSSIISFGFGFIFPLFLERCDVGLDVRWFQGEGKIVGVVNGNLPFLSSQTITKWHTRDEVFTWELP